MDSTALAADVITQLAMPADGTRLGRLQTPVWHAGTGLPAQLTLDGHDLVLAESDGSIVRFGDMRSVPFSWSGSGTQTQLTLQSAGGLVAVGFRGPKQKGGDDLGVADDGVALLIALPLYGVLTYAERKSILRRIRRWCDALALASAR
jgi:hypothetical protein